MSSDTSEHNDSYDKFCIQNKRNKVCNLIKVIIKRKVKEGKGKKRDGELCSYRPGMDKSKNVVALALNPPDCSILLLLKL